MAASTCLGQIGGGMISIENYLEGVAGYFYTKLDEVSFYLDLIVSENEVYQKTPIRNDPPAKPGALVV